MLDERGYAISLTHTPRSVAFLVLLIIQIFDSRKLIHEWYYVIVHYIL